MSRKSERISHGLQHRLAEILEHRVNDPRLKGLTVVEVKASADGSFARVFYRTLEDDREPAAQALAKAKPYIRRLLAQELPLRRVPELDFRYDPAADSGARVDAILREIEEERDEPEDDRAD